MTSPGPQLLEHGSPPDPTAGGPADSFVINLCSSTTPMALTEPKLPELKRFRFFVSRRLEDGRERFRLHMGDFASMAEAEELLPLVREIYPGAWAGEAPGKRLRARMAAAAPVAPAPAPAAPAAAAAAHVTVIRPAAPAAASLPELKPAATPALPPAAASVAARAPRPAAGAAQPAASVPPAAGIPRQSVPAAPAQPLEARSNVRQVLALLDDGAVPAAKATAKPAASGISDSQALRILENRDGVSDPEISMMQPEDTGTRQMIREAAAQSAPVAFAVQLQFSVQPIDMARVPPLAIFSAYTLYTVEGSRDGRRWYGLRLGFFTDAISAKQVAHYVRSDFKTVAIVPVSPHERSAAGGGSVSSPSASAAPQTPARATIDRLPEATAEFKLFDEKEEKEEEARAAKLAAQTAAEAAARKQKQPAAPAPSPAPVKGGPVDARARRRPQTLEETLEILGADALKMETADRRGPGGGGHRSAKPQKNSAFSRLLDRLAERGR